MALRTINYSVTATDISPKTIQNGGVQGESNATNVIFTLSADLATALNAEAGSTYTLGYRVDATSGAGGYHPSELLVINSTNNTITYTLPQEITSIYGVCKLHLIISLLNSENIEEQILFSAAAMIRISSSASASYAELAVKRQITGAVKTVIDTKTAAETAAQTASQKATESSSYATSANASQTACNEYAATATTKSSEASVFAAAASQSATAAATSATNSENLAISSEVSANNSAASASNSETFATNAATSATAASASETNANSYAVNASASATAATISASNAFSSAATAATSAANAEIAATDVVTSHNSSGTSHADIRTQINERTSYGVYTGLGVTAQSTPNMTVSVATGTIYMADGTRYTPTANTALAVNAADVTNSRIDIVYVSSTGVISYLAGTAAASPTVPTTPTGGQKLAEISVAANATNISYLQIRDMRKKLVAGTFRKIRDVTLTEAVNTVQISVDNAGQPFQLSQFVIYFYAPAIPGGNGVIYVAIPTYTGTSYIPIGQYTALYSAIEARYGKIESIFNGRWSTSFLSGAASAANASAKQDTISPNNTYFDSKCRGIQISINLAAYSWQVGSTFEIWGIDA